MSISVDKKLDDFGIILKVKPLFCRNLQLEVIQMKTTNVNLEKLVNQSQLSLQSFEEEYGQQLAPFQQKMFMIGYALGKLEEESKSSDKLTLKRLILERV